MLPGVYSIIAWLIFSVPGCMLPESGPKLCGNGPVHRYSFSNEVLGKRWHLALVLHWEGRLEEFALLYESVRWQQRQNSAFSVALSQRYTI